MLFRRATLLIAATALLGAVSGAAHAADKGKSGEVSVRSESVNLASPGASLLKWDARKGRWGLMLNLQQPDTRASTWNDVQAGAYYRVTPSLQVGVAGAIGDQQLVTAPRKLTPDEGQPRVQFETRFKF